MMAVLTGNVMADATGSTSQVGAILHEVARLAGRRGCGGRPTDGWPAVAPAVDVAALLRDLQQRERFDEKKRSGVLPYAEPRGRCRASQISYTANKTTAKPLKMKSAFAIGALMSSSHAEITSQAPSKTSIHSSKKRSAQNVKTSDMMIRNPTATAVRDADALSVKFKAHGDTQIHIPRSRLSQSCHSLGRENDMLPPLLDIEQHTQRMLVPL
jgi:hypothetical protein